MLPCLFNAYTNTVMDEGGENGDRKEESDISGREERQENTVHALLYADDFFLCGESEELRGKGGRGM